THLYANHFEQAKLQLTREPLPLCQLKLNPDVKDIFDFKFEDIEIVSYDSFQVIYFYRVQRTTA
ncbi:thymidylate synthase, partial [Acinetobacter baumannii]|uniref:thymidylate synthase n=1 Tax=Acinetobacter baumannii TaxID=470 RepID=UPI000B1CB5FD